LEDSINNNSIVINLSYGDIDFLFMGDAEHDAEASMLVNGIVPDIEVLKIGYHGSRTSSSIQFLSTAKPEYAIYMAGDSNIYGHPHQETITALESATNTIIYGTDESGTIIVTTDGSLYSVSPTRVTQSEPISDIKVTNFSVNPKNVLAGRTVNVSANFTNLSRGTKAPTAILKVNGNVVETKTFLLDARESQPIGFTLKTISSGIYLVKLGGLTDTLVVRNDIEEEPEAKLFLNIVPVTDSIGRGQVATLEAETFPGAECNITVYYKSGHGEASGLYSKKADNHGNVSWSWKVGTRTTPGVYRIVVTAYLDGKTVSQTTYFTVD